MAEKPVTAPGWLGMAGDFVPPEADRWTADELAAGIREGGGGQPMTGHGRRRYSAAMAFPGSPWLEVNTAYSDAKGFPQALRTEYRRRPVKPFVLLENIYEDENRATPELIRAQAHDWLLILEAATP